MSLALQCCDYNISRNRGPWFSPCPIDLAIDLKPSLPVFKVVGCNHKVFVPFVIFAVGVTSEHSLRFKAVVFQNPYKTFVIGSKSRDDFPEVKS